MFTTKHQNFQYKGYLFNEINSKSPFSPIIKEKSQDQKILKRRNLKNKLNDFNSESIIEKKNYLNENSIKDSVSYKLKPTSYFTNDNQDVENKNNLRSLLNNTFSHIDKINLQQEKICSSNNLNEKGMRIPMLLDNLRILSPKNVNTSTRNASNITNSIKNDNFNTENHSPHNGFTLKTFEGSKFSFKPHGIVRGYAANTNQGIVREYNEDRVSIILNIVKPLNYKGSTWPNISFFGIYDGHGGNACSDYLRDNLHQLIIKDPNFPLYPNQAIINGFEQAEREFLQEKAMSNGKLIEKSGSCAIVLLIIDETIYVANVGDSRAIISTDQGKIVYSLSKDHKPNCEEERRRIYSNGGKVYQHKQNVILPSRVNLRSNTVISSNFVGPYRVFPGRLSVSRTFGDIEAKYKNLGGLPNVVIATPEINSFRYRNNMDFIVIGSDGIFDQLSNEEVSKYTWMSFRKNQNDKNLHSMCGTAVDIILKTSLAKKSLDNVTCLLIALPNLERFISTGNNNSELHTVEDDKSLYLKRLKLEYSTDLQRNKNNEVPLRTKSSHEFKRYIYTNSSIDNNSLNPLDHQNKISNSNIYNYKENRTNYNDFTSFNQNKDTYKNNNFNHKSKQLMQDKGTEYQYGFISHYNK